MGFSFIFFLFYVIKEKAALELEGVLVSGCEFACMLEPDRYRIFKADTIRIFCDLKKRYADISADIYILKKNPETRNKTNTFP